MNYIINKNTLALLYVEKKVTKVIEKNSTFLIRNNILKIIKESCKFYGSTYIGRIEGTKTLIDINYKIPIILEETRNMIFFPTSSPRDNACAWISLKNIDSYKKKGCKTVIIFKNNYKLLLNISTHILEKQMLKSLLLETKLRSRKK